MSGTLHWCQASLPTPHHATLPTCRKQERSPSLWLALLDPPSTTKAAGQVHALACPLQGYRTLYCLNFCRSFCSCVIVCLNWCTLAESMTCRKCGSLSYKHKGRHKLEVQLTAVPLQRNSSSSFNNLPSLLQLSAALLVNPRTAKAFPKPCGQSRCQSIKHVTCKDSASSMAAKRQPTSIAAMMMFKSCARRRALPLGSSVLVKKLSSSLASCTS